jgi:DNA integrity scanning protein DisA with diadenylate cyclase activity/mannitol/fructose-specific phosphotransferase system IIA component (Ntr-type)
MDLSQLVNAMQLVEMSAKTRTAAIRSLVQATGLDREGIALDDVLAAIEEREATAQTIIEEGFALPHAVINWDGDFRIVLGRSRQGVEFGIPESGRVHLIALFVVSRQRQQELHLELLSALAELLESSEFRREIIEASSLRAIEALLLARVGLTTEGRPRRSPGVPRLNAILVRKGIELVDEVNGQALLVAVNRMKSVPWEPLSEWDGRLLVITSEPSDDPTPERPDTHFFEVPHASLTRMDRANLGLLLAASVGLLKDSANVVCITGPGGRRLDSIAVAEPRAQFGAIFGDKSTRKAAQIRPAVILRTLSLAVELAAEGREGQPVGALLVVGDSRQVMRHAQQLVLNPFHGYSRALRSLLDPSLGETIKEFASIDGAFIVQADGMVLSAGTYLLPKVSPARLPGGLGTRHQVAAAITAQTQAMAVVVSQSTGTVTVFRQGQIVLKLEHATATRS